MNGQALSQLSLLKKDTPLERGIIATILRSHSDSTNAGPTSAKFGACFITLIGEFDEIPEKFKYQVFRVKNKGSYVYCEPVAKVPEGHHGWMNGGNFAYARELSDYPIPIHDRSETYSEYDLYSR